MQLTRRDALLALTGGSLVASAAAVEELNRNEYSTISGAELKTLVALAEILYPSSVTVTDEFVENYVLGRKAVDETYLSAIGTSVDVVQATSKRETGRRYASLNRDRRDDVLRATGANRAYPHPEGTTAQRIRYYVVDELLYAFYATPKGAELVRSENPTGYPGGTEAYQQPPIESDER
jgi:hypothetical protein